jgi:hypothetical protein
METHGRPDIKACFAGFNVSAGKVYAVDIESAETKVLMRLRGTLQC